MKALNQHIKESILDDFDDIDRSFDPKRIVKDWIKNNYKHAISLKISNKPNKDGKYEVSAKNVVVYNQTLTSLTNDMFVWKKVGSFNCSDCTSLTSLEGAPKEVEGNFYCDYCDSLTSLEGAPEKVAGDFYGFICNSLKTLKGAPKEIGGCFDCRYCNSLISYELPKETKIKGNFIK